jgi:3-dehydroquinate synthetase
MPADDRAALASVIAKMGPLPAITDVPVPELLEAVGHDKKVIQGRLHYVLPKALGVCKVVSDVTREELAAALVAVGAAGEEGRILHP